MSLKYEPASEPLHISVKKCDLVGEVSHLRGEVDPHHVTWRGTTIKQGVLSYGENRTNLNHSGSLSSSGLIVVRGTTIKQGVLSCEPGPNLYRTRS